MTIRSKLAWTFILLLIFGITAISSYSIVFIRDYLLEEGKQEISKDTRWLAVTVESFTTGERLDDHFREAARISGYRLAVYDEQGRLMDNYPDSVQFRSRLGAALMDSLQRRDALPLIDATSQPEMLIGYQHLSASNNEARYIAINQLKDRIYAPIKTIRWIIYYGMFISIGLVILVSIWISRSVTKPIRQIGDAARAIARGDVDRQIHLNRNDEFGTLADSLNSMASKLREDTEQIKEIAEKQRQFFGDITHEIRNPLHTISASLEMLELESLPEEKRLKYHRNAVKQVERISRLFKDLLTLQRFQSDENFIEQKGFDLGVIGEHMQEWYGEKAAEKGIDLEMDTHSCRAVGDPGKIEQVIDNLISNAVKYTNEGSIRLTYAREGEQVAVRVEDTGIGISEEHLGRLFDRFYRTDKARSRDKGGTGLGLSVVKSILDAHDSPIEVESTLGGGTTFRFRLPAEKGRS